ncbi:MAG: hypothetical protein LBP41_00130 [Holosporaceae bacterium]|nr:hypothetical protein [Holosporaceae bacterium]
MNYFANSVHWQIRGGRSLEKAANMNSEDLNLLKNEDFKRWKKLFPPTVSDEILIMKWKHRIKQIEEHSRKVSKEEKKQIIHDWEELLPNMRRVSRTPNVIGFCKFVGALKIAVGIEFLHANRDYRFSLYVSTYISDDYGASLSANSIQIPSNKHKDRYLKEFEKGKSKFLLPLEGIISVSMIFDAFKKYSEKNILHTDSSEMPALIAAWAGMNDLSKKAADWTEETLRRQVSKCTNCTIEDYTFKSYTSFEDWREKFNARLADRAGLQKLFEDKIKEHKLEKVPREELILE